MTISAFKLRITTVLRKNKKTVTLKNFIVALILKGNNFYCCPSFEFTIKSGKWENDKTHL